MGGLTLVETRVEASDYNISYNAVARQEILVEIHTKSARSYEASFEDAKTSAVPSIAVRSYEHSYEAAFSVSPRLVGGTDLQPPYEVALPSPLLVCPPCPPCRIDHWMADVFVEQPIDPFDTPYVFIEFINPAE